MYKKILVPLDGSEHSEAVLPYVVALAQCTGAEIVFARVVTHPAVEFAMADPFIISRLSQDLHNDAEDYLRAIQAKFEKQNIHVTTQCIEGPIAQSILDIANQVHADLIAMSTHGRSGAARWLLGSVADRIAHSSPLPLLLIRPGHKAESEGLDL